MNVDVAIIGGGLAGCAAGLGLARGWPGLRVVLLEQKRYPSDKLCGEFLSPECGAIFERLGVGEAVRALTPAVFHHVRVTSPDGTVWEAPLPGEALGVSRLALDGLLFEAAARSGVEAWSGARVSGIAGGLREGFEIECRRGGGVESIRARAAIGAHGKRSSVDRMLARPFLRRRQPFLALKAHFDGPAPDGWVELHGFPGGYCGINRVEGGAVNVCLLVHERGFREAGGAPREFVDWMRARNERLDAFFARARSLQPWMAIAGVPFDAKPAVEGDVLMAGDSAGLISPLAGNGQAMALQAGEMAARLLGPCLSGCGAAWAQGLPRHYARAWRLRFGYRMALGRRLQDLMLNPRGLDLGVRVLNALPGLGRYVVTRTREV